MDVERWEPDPGPPYEQWLGLAPATGTANTLNPDESSRQVLADLIARPRGLGEPYLVLVPAARSADIPAVMGWNADVRCGATAYLDNDLRAVGQLLQGAAATLDLSQPIAVMLLIVLHLIPDADDPRGIVARLMGGVAPGSYLVISHPASDIRAAAMAEMTRRVNARLASARGTMRSRAEIARFFEGTTLLEPGVVQPQQWRPTGPWPRPTSPRGAGSPASHNRRATR